MTKPRVFNKPALSWSKWLFGFGASLAVVLALAQVVQPSAKFAVESLRNENMNGRPTAVVRFNQALDTAQAFDTLASLTTNEGGHVDGSWALSRDARALEFPFLQTQAHFQVHISASLRAADGSQLSSDFESQLSTAQLPADARFLSNGSVIPRHAHQGLPIASTNVESVDVEFLRVRPAEYARFFLGYPLDYGRWPGIRRQNKREGGDVQAEHSWKSELERVTEFTDSVYQQRFTLEHPSDKRALTYLAVHQIAELRRPGVYMAVMKQPNSFPYTWHTAFFFVTDLGLHARRYGDKVWVHAASLETGKPLANTMITAQGDLGLVLAQGSTDAEGNAWLNIAAQGNGSSEDTRSETEHSELLLLSAEHAHDVAILPFNQAAIDLSALPITGRKQQPFDIFSWGSRDLYRPGETLRVHLLLRDHDGHLLKPQPLFAELLDPDGESVQKMALELDALGYTSYVHELAGAGKTGLYKLQLSTDGNAQSAPFSFDIHVEEFLPERIKIDLNSAQATLTPGESLSISASSAYLYGAPAGGNRFVASMVLVPALHPIELQKDFYFGDASARFDSTPSEVLDTTFDAQGLINADIDLSGVAQDKGPIEVKILGEVSESGGRAVNKVLKRVIWPAPVLLGLRAQFNDDSAPGDATAKFDVIASDVAGVRHAVSGIKVRVLRDWRDYSWYYRDDNSFDVSVISASNLESEQTIDLKADGRAFELAIPVQWGGYWVELIHPESGVVTRYHFSAGWSWGGDSEIAREPRPDQIKLELDKKSYRVGDTAKLTLHAPQAGRGFIVVESGEQLFQAPIEAKPDASVEIPIDASFNSHDIYISAVVLRPDGSKDAVVPSRAVGMIHLPMDRSERSVQIQLAAPKLSRPGTPMHFSVDAPTLKAKQAFVVLTAVDAGITNITRYQVPDPAGFFFGQRRYGLDIYDVYGRIVENFAGKRAGLRYGGDGESPELPELPRDKLEVKMIDLYQGPVTLDSNGHASVDIIAPDFDGTLAVTALLFSSDSYGRAQSESIVRQPVIAQLSAPRALAPGDKAMIALDVSNLSGTAQAIGLKIAATGGVVLRDAVPASVPLADGAKQTLLVGLNAERIGPAQITVQLSAKEGAVSRSVATVVRPAYAPERRIEQRTLTGPTVINAPAALITGLLPGAKLQFTVSNRPLLPLAGAAKEITETLWWYSYLKLNVQRGFAQALLDTPARAQFGIRTLDDGTRRALVQAAIDEALAAQTPLGHFNMWGKDSWVDTQLTPYVAEFWLKTRQLGYRVDQIALSRTLERMQQDLANGGNPYMGFEHHEAIKFANNAYAAYVLSLNSTAPIGTLRTLYNEHAKDAKTMLSLVHLGLALKTMGDTTLGDQALNAALVGKWENAWGIGDYGSNERDMAWTYALLSEYQLLTPAWQDKLMPLARNLSGRSRDQRWKGSYLSADEALALVRLGVRLLGEPSAPLKGSFLSGGSKTLIQSARQFSVEFDAAQLPQTSATLESAGTLYVEWNSVGFAAVAPPPDQSQVAVTREYFTFDGAPFRGNSLKQGERLLVHITVQAERDIRDAVLVDLQPGGLEVENLHLGDFAELANVKIGAQAITEYNYGQTLRRQEYLDDRYLAAIDFSAWHGGTINLFYVVRAVTPGDYVVPPPFVEDMFRPQIRGNGASVMGRLTVQ